MRARSRLMIVPTLLMLGALIAAPSASADPGSDLPGARSFDLDCGADGTYAVVFVESNLGTFHVTGDSTRIFQSTSLTIEGNLVFAEPGFDTNGRAQLHCSFRGVVTGRLFEVTGFFTPPRP